MIKAKIMTAGQRIKLLRITLNQTRQEFGALIDVEIYRLRNVESGRVRAAEEELANVSQLCPELIHWIVYEGDISMAEVRKSESPIVRLFGAQVDAGMVPKGEGLEDKLVD